MTEYPSITLELSEKATKLKFLFFLFKRGCLTNSSRVLPVSIPSKYIFPLKKWCYNVHY